MKPSGAGKNLKNFEKYYPFSTLWLINEGELAKICK
jgi:hypothetical protein